MTVIEPTMSSECPHAVGRVGVLIARDLRQLLQNPSCDVCRSALDLSAFGFLYFSSTFLNFSNYFSASTTIDKLDEVILVPVR